MGLSGAATRAAAHTAGASHTGTSAGAAAHSTRTAHLTAVKGTEAVGQRQDNVSPESIVDHLAMGVGGVGNRQVLSLAEYVVALKGESELLPEQEFLELGIEHILRGLSRAVSVIPVLIAFGLEGEPGGIPGPVGGKADLVVEGSGPRIAYGVPALAHTGTSGCGKFQVVGTVSESQALHQV